MSDLEEFELFPKLAVELRLKIWHIAVLDARRIAHMGPISQPCTSCNKNYACAIELRTEYPTLINACRESRGEALRLKAEFKNDARTYHYQVDKDGLYYQETTDCDLVGPIPDPTFFNFQQDTVCLDLSMDRDTSGRPGVQDGLIPSIEVMWWLESNGIRSLALDKVVVRFTRDYRYMMRYFTLPYQTLKELEIVRFVTEYPSLHPPRAEACPKSCEGCDEGDPDERRVIEEQERTRGDHLKGDDVKEACRMVKDRISRYISSAGIPLPLLTTRSWEGQTQLIKPPGEVRRALLGKKNGEEEY